MKEYKVITALFLSAVMLGTAPLTVWGAESFSTGESFSDGTENIPDIVTDSALSGESSERDYELSIETASSMCTDDFGIIPGQSYLGHKIYN